MKSLCMCVFRRPKFFQCKLNFFQFEVNDTKRIAKTIYPVLPFLSRISALVTDRVVPKKKF